MVFLANSANSSKCVLCGELCFNANALGAELVTDARHAVTDAFAAWLRVAYPDSAADDLRKRCASGFELAAAGEGLTNAYKHYSFDLQVHGDDSLVEITWSATRDLFSLEISNPTDDEPLPHIASAVTDVTDGGQRKQLPEGGMGLGIIKAVVAGWPEGKANCELKADGNRAVFSFEVRR